MLLCTMPRTVTGFGVGWTKAVKYSLIIFYYTLYKKCRILAVPKRACLQLYTMTRLHYDLHQELDLIF